jgi:DNA-binding transcriptional LysR family regulator
VACRKEHSTRKVWVRCGIEVTDSGKVFFPKAQAILAQAERAKKIAHYGNRDDGNA